MEPVKAYQNRKECQTLDALAQIEGDVGAGKSLYQGKNPWKRKCRTSTTLSNQSCFFLLPQEQ